MKQLWIQYTYADEEKASVCQTANSEEEARSDSDLFPGCPWYRYDIVPGPGYGDLVNPAGPFYYDHNLTV